jgi:hypothetical protein
MAHLIKGLCVFLGIMVGNFFLNGACVSNGSDETPNEFSRTMVMILTGWGSISLCLKVADFVMRRREKKH